MIKSALESSLLSDGMGSKVCELIPSGMMPGELNFVAGDVFHDAGDRRH